MAVTFKELSTIAELHYGKLPEAFKKQASDFFDELDVDGDGMVTLPGILKSNLEAKFGEEFLQHVFYSLDEEGKGHLDFREYLTLYYLCIYSARTCITCRRNVPQGLGYTCLKCLKDKEPPHNPYILCLECYSSHHYQHEHAAPHLLHDFVLFDNLVHLRLSSPSTPPPAPVRAIEQTMKQCLECGDFHESRAKGFMCDVHMSKKRDSTEFVCEWCFSYFCSKCGNLFRDSTTRAEPGKWLQRFICPSCHQKNVPGDCYDASLQRLQRVLAGADLLKHCRTCEIKQRNGTLFWIINGTNMSELRPELHSRNLPSEQTRQSQPPTYSRQGGDGSGHGGGRGQGRSLHEGSMGVDVLSRGGGSGGGARAPGRRFDRAGSGDSDSSNDGSGGGSFCGGRGRGASGATASPSILNVQDLAAAARVAGRVINVAARAANMLNGGTGNGDGGGAGDGSDGVDSRANIMIGVDIGGDGGNGSTWYG